ncbi:MAG: rod shape-determining protein [Acidobacteria bacterium]|nr:rod shape-determining protein [Acidobacteriota bacterium]
MENETKALSVGVDLGTSRSAISASSGERHLVLSYVGWPVDMVARKVLKQDVLIGEEALENRLMLDLHRPLESGLIKEGSDRDAMAVRELLQQLLTLAGVSEAREQGIPVRAVVGVPAEAMRVNKQQLRASMEGLVDFLMIVSEPFAVAYGLDALLHALIIDIGAGTTDMCVMNGRYPKDEDQKTLTMAGDSIDDQLEQLIQTRYPEAHFSRHMVTAWKEGGSFVGQLSGKIMVSAPAQGKPTDFDITEDMRTACSALLPPVVEAMIDLISRVEPEYQAKVRNNVILTGGSSLISGLGAALQEALLEVGGGKVRVVKDPAFVGSDGGLAIATDAPDSDWETLAT